MRGAVLERFSRFVKEALILLLHSCSGPHIFGESGDMKDIHLQEESLEMRVSAKGIVIAVALGKAVVAGVGLGIAILGALDIAFAATAREWWASIQPDALLNYAAASGGAMGFLWQAAQLIMATR